MRRSVAQWRGRDVQHPADRILYFKKKKPCLLLVNKNLSFDSSFKGDFNLDDGMIAIAVTSAHADQFRFTWTIDPLGPIQPPE